MMPSFSYLRARSLAEAVHNLGPESRPLSGGTDLLGCLRAGINSAQMVVSLSQLTDLRGLSVGAGGRLVLGALTTIDEVATSAVVRARLPILADAAAEVASPQLRHQGTVGGNLCQRPRCWYFRGGFACLKKGGDTCFAFDGENNYHCIFGGGPCFIVHPSDTAPALVAAGAVVVISSAGGARTLPLTDFFVLPESRLDGETALRPDELVSRIEVPPLPVGTISRFRKVRARQAWDFALASLATIVTIEDGVVRRARLVLGGVAPVPWRIPAAEAELSDRPLSDETIERAADAAVADADPLENNAYKVDLVRGLIRSELNAIREG